MLSVLFRLIIPALLLLVSVSALAAKTDIVYLHNGDRITGEVKELSRGKLQFKTDHMGTIYIEWEDIREIISTTGQSVELKNGQRFYGPLSKTEGQEMLVVKSEGGDIGLANDQVIEMYPVEAGFWDRLDVTARLGFSWDKGSQVGRYSVGLDAEFRNPKFKTRADFSMEMTTQDSQPNTSRATLGMNHLVFKENKRFVDYFGNLEQNDELGLDLRALVGVGYGWVPIRSNRNWFSLAAGLDINREIPQMGDPENNLEAVGMLNYEYYKYNSPERKFSVRLLVFPSITDFGRWRVNFNTDYRIELVSDLFWVLDFYATFDNQPISEAAANSDYGVTSSLAYKF